MNTRDADLDVAFDAAFMALTVKQKHLEPALGARVLAFARLKRKPLVSVLRDLGVLSEKRIERTSRLARYRVARSEDRHFAQIAVKLELVSRAVAAGTLARQRLFFRAGRGFLRFLALLRADAKITHEQDKLVRQHAQDARLGRRTPREDATQISSPVERSGSRSRSRSRTAVEPARPSGSGSTYGRVIAALA